MIAVLLAAPLAARGQTAPQMEPASRHTAELLAVTVNGLAGDDLGAVFLRDGADRLYASAAFLAVWNLRAAGARLLDTDGTVFFDLSATPGLAYQWDRERAELIIGAAAEAFLPTRLNIGAGPGRKVAPYAPGAYLNYDVSLANSGGVRTNQALLDVALFRGVGLLTSSFTTGSLSSARLMTTWQTDKVDAIKTLRIGDSTNHTGAWGRGVLFGGVQYGTNFAVRPEFISMAMPSISGKALLPSTVDVYVNRALRSRQSVNAGPFAIQNLPVISGAGDVQLVVTDLLGREQLITQSFFASPSLLREGLVEDTYEFGWLRQNYGLKSSDYSAPFAAATYRKGLTSRVTGEARVEWQRDLAVAGGSVATALPAISSVVESSLALSGAAGLPPGRMGSVAWSYLGRSWSGNVRMQMNSLAFRQVGSDPASLPQQIATAQLGVPIGTGTLSVNYVRRLNQGESMARLINLNYSQRIADGMFASFTLLQPLSGNTGPTIALALTIVFDQKHIGSTTLNGRPGAAALYTEFQQSTPREGGVGYRVAALHGGDQARQEATVTRNQSFGSAQAELVRLNGAVSSRLSAHGGIATLAGGVYFTRGRGEGFAVVETGDIAGVPVSLENQVVAHTDKRGRAVVSNLRAYQQNRIGIDPLKLPMDAVVGAVEKMVVPRAQGGVVVDFGVRRVRSATLTIVQADGTPLPAWTPVEVVGIEGAFVSGLRGEVFVDLPNATGNHVIARPPDGPACELVVDLPATASAAPFLPTQTCRAAR